MLNFLHRSLIRGRGSQGDLANQSTARFSTSPPTTTDELLDEVRTVDVRCMIYKVLIQVFIADYDNLRCSRDESWRRPHACLVESPTAQ